MEGISKNGEGDVVLLHQPQEPPEVGVKNRVAAGDVEVGQAVINFTEIKAVVKGVLHLLPVHGIQLFAVVLREDVAVLAPLVALIGDVPLKRKILFHLV